MPKFRLALSFSLLLLAMFAWAEVGQFEESLRKARTVDQALQLAETGPATGNSEVEQARRRLIDAKPAQREAAVKALREAATRASLESPRPLKADANRLAREIKQNPLYAEANQRQGANWLQTALERLRNLFNRDERERRRQPNQMGRSAEWLLPVIWAVIGAIVIAFAWFALRHVSWKGLKKRRRKAVLEDDEPQRTLDEWLALADQLTAEGKHREAVRALYLACLLKFDEHRVARFLRGETNWEHLRRIRASQRLPAGLDFQSATARFDRIWYGHDVRGLEDVQQFRAQYEEVTRRLTEDRP